MEIYHMDLCIVPIRKKKYWMHNTSTATIITLNTLHPPITLICVNAADLCVSVLSLCVSIVSSSPRKSICVHASIQGCPADAVHLNTGTGGTHTRTYDTQRVHAASGLRLLPEHWQSVLPPKYLHALWFGPELNSCGFSAAKTPCCCW